MISTGPIVVERARRQICALLDRHRHHFQNRTQPIQFTRSRPYQSNDNAHVEQKNWSCVRQLFGYDRFHNPKV
ncbi:MAG TPA: hypothetical protein VJQ52_08570, partial [Steroidobacteraceae bacterium]|nr:hypothetical protein [Steroidobacteraceae bacterium]